MNPSSNAFRAADVPTAFAGPLRPAFGARAPAPMPVAPRRSPPGRLVGNSAALREVRVAIARVAPTEAAVLILGETGTGKELLARAVHEASRRAERPMVRVDCSSLTATLSESELFGHLRGAFTGAVARRAGRVELAHRGTLFLDEIGELPLEHQAKLLRVLQEGEFEPLGASETVRVDIRVIAATHRPLAELVAAGAFRADLYHRLAAFVVRVPPLRDRSEDIPELVTHLLVQQAERMGRSFEPPAADVMRALMRHSWPGNVRELQNAVQRACIVANGSTLEAADFGLAAQGLEPAPGGPVLRCSPLAGDAAPGSAPATSLRTLREVEREHICAVLRACGGAIEGASGAARALGLPPSTLRFRIRKLGIVHMQGSSRGEARHAADAAAPRGTYVGSGHEAHAPA